MARVSSWIGAHRAATIIVAVVCGIAFVASFVGIARATDQPSFCGAACHEMSPYHEAWSTGAHKDIACVDCHVDSGTTARMAHKVEAMKEVWSHFTKDQAFPLSEGAGVPNKRCVSCHKDIPTTIDGFSHADHAAKGDCQSCHSDAGHEVSDQALKDAGIFNADAKKEKLATRVATVDGGIANVQGHKPVTCVRCHDMQKTGCSSCHTPKHKATGPAEKTAQCNTCHQPGQIFVFEHPAGTDCASCHKTPTEAKHDYSQECVTCHTQAGASWTFTHTNESNCLSCHTKPAEHRAGACSACHKPGKSWAFNHPASSSSCTSCHSKPAGHRSGSCTQCHKTGVSWAFSHPAGSSCTSCHNRPSGHRSGSCTQCHKAGSSWAFRHPGSGAKCASCHAKPSGHSTKACTNCHKVGKSWAFSHPGSKATCTNCHNRPGGHRAGSCASCHSTASWAFRHPSSSSCSSCHKAPGGHYGTSCASCHSPSRAWSNASFSHPRIPGGEHTYKSFSCSKCHPSGYSSYSCRACHDSNSGPSDD